MTSNYDDGNVGWNDFTPEPEVTGDGAGDPDKHILTIVNYPGEDNEEVCVIVHRTCDGRYPIDGVLANRKRRVAQVICDALNANHSGQTFADQLDWTDEEQQLDVPASLVVRHHDDGTTSTRI